MSLVTEQMMLNTIVAEYVIKQMSYIGISVKIQLAEPVSLISHCQTFQLSGMIFVLVPVQLKESL